MRDRRDDERSFRGSMGQGRDEDRFRDHDRDREWERERAWRREQDMGGSRWSGASGRGGYDSRDEQWRMETDRDRDRHGERDEGGYGAYGRDRNEPGYGGYDRARHERDDFDDRPRNLGARDYETRHFYGGRGGFGAPSEGWGVSRSYERGYDPTGPGRSFGAFQGSYGAGDYSRGAPMGRARATGVSGSDLGFSYRGHEGSGDIHDRGPHYGKGPKGYKRSDDRVREDVCDCIARQGHIDASDVEVKVENGTVILSGTVGERHHKRVLEQMVERLHGVEDVRNELRLKRDEQTQMRGQQQTTGTAQNGDQNRQSNFPNGKNARA